MKKFLVLFLLAFAFIGVSNAQIKFPVGKATITNVVDDTLSYTLAVKNTVEFLNIDALTLDTNSYTINITNTYAEPGFLLYIEAAAGDTVSLSYGTAIKGTNATLLEGKTYFITAVYNGTDYVVAGIKQED